MSQAQPSDLFETRMASAGSEGTAGIEFDGQTGTYRVTAYGADAPGSGDPMPTAWTSLKGDFILRVHLAFEGPTPDPMDRMGLVIREEPRKEAAYVSGTVSGAGRAFLETPPARDEPALTESPAAGIPDVLQIERRGDLFIVSSARDGQPWVHQERTIELDNYVFAGLFVEAARPGRNLTARFWNVRLIKPEPPQQEAYRDYLGSRLEILDTKTGLRRVVLESTHSIQAPNWTPDGKTLIYNSHGYLYTYDLESGSVGMLNTGFANRNNNDHVLSADGHFLAISHHNEADNGASSIYYLPVSGSVEPVKVTRDGVGPSYLHGWSADRSTMLFTGARNGQYDIYAVDVATGEETQLTNEPGLE